MVKRSFALWCVLAVAAATAPVAAGDGVIEFVDCGGLRLSLEEADHSYWASPEKGRVVMVRACGPVEDDCNHDVITVWDAEGRKIFEAAPFLDVPEISDGRILDAALRSPDRLVASAMVGGPGAFRPVLAEYDVGTGELVRVTPTGAVQCLHLVGDHDGVTWCLGVDIERRAAGEEYDLVYRFDEVGALQGSALPRSAFPAAARPLADTWRGNFRGGFLGGGGPLRLWLPEVGELISFDEAGRVSDRLVLPKIANQQRAHLTSAPGGAVCAMLIVGDEAKPEEWNRALYRLADDGSAWLPLEEMNGPIPMQMALVGADEEGLILLDRKTLVLCHLPLAGQADTEE